MTSHATHQLAHRHPKAPGKSLLCSKTRLLAPVLHPGDMVASDAALRCQFGLVPAAAYPQPTQAIPKTDTNIPTLGHRPRMRQRSISPDGLQATRRFYMNRSEFFKNSYTVKMLRFRSSDAPSCVIFNLVVAVHRTTMHGPPPPYFAS